MRFATTVGAGVLGVTLSRCRKAWRAFVATRDEEAAGQVLDRLYREFFHAHMAWFHDASEVTAKRHGDLVKVIQILEAEFGLAPRK